MCLTTENYKGFVANRNICVVKELFKGTRYYSTPYRYVMVELNDYLIPDKAMPSIQKYQHKNYIIEGGVIHSYTTANYINDNSGFIAIIPKGCRYWIGKDNDICSEVLFITSKKYSGASHLKDIEKLFNDPNSYLYKRYNPLLKKYKRSIFRKIVYTLFKLL